MILHLLGALDDTGRVTSPVGKGMALYPLDPSLSRMLVEASRCTTKAYLKYNFD